MISVLIPVYNCPVTSLVDILLDQLQKLEINYEIIIMDDKSRRKIKEQNQPLRNKFLVNYIELSENLGRAKIRNWLAKLARYEHMLFLDCDGIISNPGFIKTYLDNINKADVICGGRIYKTSKPRTNNKMLHWSYGHKVESKSSIHRNKKPYLSFMSNNFVISKKLFERFRFDESIQGYGYEDLALSYTLQQNHVNIMHIENPVIHGHIEYNDAFLDKTKVAIDNLKKLHLDNQIMETSLIKYASMVKDLKLKSFILWIATKSKNYIENNLRSAKPRMTVFSFWKLSQFLENHTNMKELQ